MSLAIWRLSSLLASERGPYAMFDKIRELAGVHYDPVTLNPVAESELAKLVSCIWCSSVWLGAIASLFYSLFGDVIVWLALPLALSALAIIYDRIIGN